MPMDSKSPKAFAQRVDGYMAQGYRVESQTDTAATLIKGERVNHVLHLILSIVTLGWWQIVWAIPTRVGGRRYVTVQTGPSGGIHVTERRDLSGCALHALTAWIVLQSWARSYSSSSSSWRLRRRPKVITARHPAYRQHRFALRRRQPQRRFLSPTNSAASGLWTSTGQWRRWAMT